MQFDQSSLDLVYGEGTVVLVDDIPYLQKKFYTLRFTTPDGTAPLDLTDATVTAKIVRRTISIKQETPTSFSFTIEQRTTPTAAIDLAPIIVDANDGVVILPSDNSQWDIDPADPELGIAVENPVCFTGNLMVSFPASGSNPAYDMTVFFLFLVRNNGANNVV